MMLCMRNVHYVGVISSHAVGVVRTAMTNSIEWPSAGHRCHAPKFRSSEFQSAANPQN